MPDKASVNLDFLLSDEDDVQNGLDLDDVLPDIGDFGKYQKILFWFVCLPACIPCGFCAFNQLFMADVPQHWCKIPLLMMMSPEKRKRLGIPLQEGSNVTYSSCTRFSVNWSEIDLDDLDVVVSNQSWPVESCRDGWEYDTSQISSSIVIDFDLVCERDLYPTIGLAALNLGGPFGVYFFGILNDKYDLCYNKNSEFWCERYV